MAANFINVVKSKKESIPDICDSSCRNNDMCRLNGHFKARSVIYEARVEYAENNSKFSNI